jgi:hypothetical protein
VSACTPTDFLAVVKMKVTSLETRVFTGSNPVARKHPRVAEWLKAPLCRLFPG